MLLVSTPESTGCPIGAPGYFFIWIQQTILTIGDQTIHQPRLVNLVVTCFFSEKGWPLEAQPSKNSSGKFMKVHESCSQNQEYHFCAASSAKCHQENKWYKWSQIWSDVAPAQDPWPALDFRYHISFLHSTVNGLIWESSNQEPLAYSIPSIPSCLLLQSP